MRSRRVLCCLMEEGDHGELETSGLWNTYCNGNACVAGAACLGTEQHDTARPSAPGWGAGRRSLGGRAAAACPPGFPVPVPVPVPVPLVVVGTCRRRGAAHGMSPHDARGLLLYRPQRLVPAAMAWCAWRWRIARACVFAACLVPVPGWGGRATAGVREQQRWR
jgi:hypothetical protein